MKKVVKLQKLGLFLKISNKDSPKLINLEKNIKCGNSLISGINENNFKLFEDDLKNILLCENKDDKNILKESLNLKINNNLKEYFGEDYKNVKPFNWEVEFIEIFFKINENGKLERKGFDVVIGNPPYVRHELIKEYKKYFEKNYKVYQGRADLYVYFFEKGLNNLVENGKFAFIVSNKFTRANYGKNLREYILKNTKFLQYIDEFKKNQVFEGAVVDPCIIFLEKNILEKENQKIFFNYKNKISQNSLTNESWSFRDEKKLKILEKIKKFKALKEIVGEAKRGIKSGANDILIVDENKKKEIIKNNKNEEKVFVKFLKGKCIKKYNYSFDEKYLIYLENKNIDEFENVKKYLLENKNILEKRTDIVGTNKKWFELRPCSFYNLFEENKIIFPDISQNNNFTFDKNKIFVDMTAGFIPTKNKFFLVLLNSKLINFFYKEIASTLGEKGLRFVPQHINQIPIPEISKTEQIPFIEKAEKMLELNKNFYDKINFYLESLKIDFEVEKISKKLEEFYLLEKNEFLGELKKISKSNKKIEEFYNGFENKKEEILKIKIQIDTEDLEINKMVYGLYNLTNEEIEIIENEQPK